MKITDLHQDDRNANKGTKRGREAVRKSLEQYGAGRSVLVDRDGRLIAGNKTAESAAAAGIEDVIVVETDGSKLVAVKRTDLSLDDPKARGLAVADNRAGELGLAWDSDVLADLSQDADLSGFFTDAELRSLLPQDSTSSEDDFDAVSPPQPVTKPGDLIALGDHLLLCGDATVQTDVDRLMDGTLADVVWTDPPYNIAYEGKTKDRLTIKNDSMESDAFRSFLREAFVSMFDAARAGALIYVAHADTEGYNFRGAFTEAGWYLAECLVWVKQSMVLGRSDYHWRHEPILYGWKPGAAHNWYSNRKQTTVLEFDRPSRNAEHPTMKPVALVEYCIQNSSQRGGIVLDLFGGSGTTLIACEQTGRKARLMELDPAYCDVIVQRWETLTGKKAERIDAGTASETDRTQAA
jgi:site-specific DNA-methyltransferase (adenine-specific)